MGAAIGVLLGVCGTSAVIAGSLLHKGLWKAVLFLAFCLIAIGALLFDAARTAHGLDGLNYGIPFIFIILPSLAGCVLAAIWFALLTWWRK